MIQNGKPAAHKLPRGDAGEAGDEWSKSQIAQALATNVNTVARIRPRLVEDGFKPALAYKYSPASAKPRIL